MIRLDDDVLHLSGELSLANLMAYRREIENLLPRSGSVTVNLTELVVHGSAVLSLLVFLRRRAGATGGAVTFTGCSDVVRQMARVAELEELLGLTV
ncbi:MAG: STAS domain-containing protein [Pseudomonadales bacterium]|jgi:anti-anti-sigma factor|nr:STAS domain-containing protein [Pseudomonadales bacterium]